MCEGTDVCDLSAGEPSHRATFQIYIPYLSAVHLSWFNFVLVENVNDPLRKSDGSLQQPKRIFPVVHD